MTKMFYNSAEGVQSNVGTSWFEAGSVTGTLHAGEHFIWVYAEYGGIQTNRTVSIRVLIDGVTVPTFGEATHTPADSGAYNPFSVFGMKTVPTEGEHTISIEISAGHAAQTVNVRKIRLMIEKE